LKRWTYVGVFGPELMLCAGHARVTGLNQTFWAVWDRQARSMQGRTLALRASRVSVSPAGIEVADGATTLQIKCEQAGKPVEVVTAARPAYIWTKKTPIYAAGHLMGPAGTREVSGFGILDESSGYHDRRTAWNWSAGVGATRDGRRVIWNLVTGVHDSPSSSERTVWLDEEPFEPGPVTFSPDLDAVIGEGGERLQFHVEAKRQRKDNFGLIRSDYVQPFGNFEGVLPGGIGLDREKGAFGVMERHKAVW
jgi:hypothetical protein